MRDHGTSSETRERGRNPELELPCEVPHPSGAGNTLKRKSPGEPPPGRVRPWPGTSRSREGALPREQSFEAGAPATHLQAWRRRDGRDLRHVLPERDGPCPATAGTSSSRLRRFVPGRGRGQDAGARAKAVAQPRWCLQGSAAVVDREPAGKQRPMRMGTALGREESSEGRSKNASGMEQGRKTPGCHGKTTESAKTPHEPASTA